MDYIILYLCLDVNILKIKTWERNNKLGLDWSHVQLRLVNQSNVLPISIITQVHMEVKGLKTYDEFEVIDIVDDTNPYHTIIGIDWAIENTTIVKFKKRILSFEDYEIRVVTQIDTLEGHRYVKPVHREGKDNYIDHLYNIMSSQEQYITPTSYENLSWWSVSLCTPDSGDGLENW